MPLWGQGPYVWSPDGVYFASTSWANSTPIVLFSFKEMDFSLIYLDGENIYLDGIGWSPDGTRLAISDGIDIYIVAAKGGAITKVNKEEEGGRVIGWLSTFLRPVFKSGNILFITGAGNNLNVRSAPSITSVLASEINGGGRPGKMGAG